MAGMLYVPTFLTGVTDQGYITGDSYDGETTTGCISFRTNANLGGSWAAPFQSLWNGFIGENAQQNNNGYVGIQQSLAMTPVNWQATSQYRWANDDIFMSDILYSAGLNSYGVEGKIKGQFFDMVYIYDAYEIDIQDTFAGHTWLNLTLNNSDTLRGGVWIAIS